MLKIDLENTFKRTVEVHIPTGLDNYQTESFIGIFKYQSPEEKKELEKRKADLNDLDYMASILVGWENVIIEGQDSFEFTPENFEQLVSIPYVRTALIKAYAQAISGAGPKAKN